MQKFINQFDLSPLMAMQLENFIFRMADDMVQGYNGGSWRTKTVDGITILLIPDAAKEVTLDNRAMGGSVTTDHLTASAAFTSLVTNWYWNGNVKNLSFSSNKAFHDFHFGLRDAIYSDTPSTKINTNDYHSFTD